MELTHIMLTYLTHESNQFLSVDGVGALASRESFALELIIYTGFQMVLCDNHSGVEITNYYKSNGIYMFSIYLYSLFMFQ